MGGISGGQSRQGSNQGSQSSAISQGWSQGASGQQGSNFGSSLSNQGSQQGSANNAWQTQDVWSPQAGALQGLYGAAQGMLGGGGPAGAMNQIGNQAAGAWGQALQPGQNPYFAGNVDAAINQASQGWQREVLPGLDARGVGAGQYGSSRDSLARGEAAGMMGQGIANMTGQMYANQYGSDLQRQMQALGMTGAMQGAQMAPLQGAQGLIGGPTVLGQGGSSGSSFGSSFGTGSSLSGGQSTGWSSNASQNLSEALSSSFGNSSGKSMNFGASK